MESNKKLDHDPKTGKETPYKNSDAHYVWLDGSEKDLNKLSNHGCGSRFCSERVLVTGKAKLISCSLFSKGQIRITSTERSIVERLTAYGTLDARLTRGSLCDVSVKGHASIQRNSHLLGVELDGNISLISCDISDAYIIGTCTLVNARIEAQRDIVQITGIGREERLLTVYRAKTGKVWCSRGCFQGSLEKFLRQSKKIHTPQQRQEILAALNFASIRMGADLKLPKE